MFSPRKICLLLKKHFETAEFFLAFHASNFWDVTCVIQKLYSTDQSQKHEFLNTKFSCQLRHGLDYMENKTATKKPSGFKTSCINILRSAFPWKHSKPVLTISPGSQKHLNHLIGKERGNSLKIRSQKNGLIEWWIYYTHEFWE